MSKLYLETDIQLYKLYASWTHEVDVKNWISNCAKRTKFTGSGKSGLKALSFMMIVNVRTDILTRWKIIITFNIVHLSICNASVDGQEIAR